MLLELGKAVTFLLGLLSLYPAIFSAFFVPGARWEERLVLALDRIALSGCLCFASGLLFCLPLPRSAGLRLPLLSTLPVRLFLFAVAAMVVLFFTSWYLDVHYVPLLWRNQPH